MNPQFTLPPNPHWMVLPIPIGFFILARLRLPNE
jgi:hypothetical protein